MKQLTNIIIIYIFIVCSVSQTYSQEVFSYLVQDRLGVIWGGIASETQSSATIEVVRGMMEQPNNPIIVDLVADREGGFQLTSDGVLIPLGDAQLINNLWTPPINQCRSFALSPNNTGAWIASGDLVLLHGKPHPLVLPPTLGQGRVITDLEYDTARNRLAILLGDGGLSISYHDHFEHITAAYLEDDLAIDVEFYDDSYLILTLSGQVYRLDHTGSSLVQDMPELGKGLARDLELAPWGKGFYLLDAFGMIHHCDGAPAIESTPLQQDAAIDLEFLPVDVLPNWYPPGWDTSATLNPVEMRLDPIGSAKTLSLWIDNAENISGFVAELSYDPKLLKVNSNQVKVGNWWEKMIPNAIVQANLDDQRGKLNLFGGGSLLPNTGATGEGELASVSIMASTHITNATTTFELTNFYFRDGYSGVQYQTAKDIRSTTIFIQPIEPTLSLSWHHPLEPLDKQTLSTGDIFRIDILVESGSRIQNVVFDLLFNTSHLYFLGMTLGEGWRADTFIDPQFSIPAKANENGLLLNQTIKAKGQPAFHDELSSLVAFFFSVKSPGNGEITLKNILLKDELGRNLNVNWINQELHYMVE